jgi:Flp pilus assembly pilin Flp
MTLQAMNSGMGWMAGVAPHLAALPRFWSDESGQDMLEFALVAALLALCAVATLQGLAADVATLWGGLRTDFSRALS